MNSSVDPTRVLSSSNSPKMSYDADSLVGLKEGLKAFLDEHGHTFKQWWSTQTQKQRAYFIRDVYPPIVYSPTDRWCYVGGSDESEGGVKTYEERYLQYVTLFPEFTVQFLVDGMNIINLITEWTQSEDSLSQEISSRVVKFRSLYRGGLYIWPHPVAKHSARCNREIQVRKNDIIHLLFTSTAGQGTDADILKQRMEVNDPKMLIQGTGENFVGDHQVNLYELGIIIHPFEYETIVEALFVLMHCVSALVEEYKEEILKISMTSEESVAKAIFQCQSCGSKENIKKCRQCMTVWYCSTDCQKKHWPKHRDFCKQFKVNTASSSSTAGTGST